MNELPYRERFFPLNGEMSSIDRFSSESSGVNWTMEVAPVPVGQSLHSIAQVAVMRHQIKHSKSLVGNI